MCAVLQNYTTISGFDKGVCSACISHEKVLPMQIEYMKLSMYVYGGWTKNRCMEVKLSLHALNSYSLVATKLGMLL